MKKHTKVLAALSTAAVMAAFAPALFPQAAASNVYAGVSGWTEENGGWVYYDKDGYLLTDSWKKEGEDWFYLDSEGMLARDMQIDEYYVGEDGRRVSNTWISVENEDYGSDDEEPEFYWYYYGKDGKALTSRWYKIDGHTYYFNEDSQMETGAVVINGFHYYLGDENDGKMKTGWILLEDETDDPDVTESWFYYDRTGKRVENEVDKKIDGAYYTFEDGRMQTGWYKLPVQEISQASASEAAPAPDLSHTAAGYQYYDEDGKRVSGWRTIQGIPGLSEEDETFRFHFKNGVPCHGQTDLEIFTIDSKRYAFNVRGEMETGMQTIPTDEGSAVYYFGEDGVMRTGKQVIENQRTGERENWYFHTNGSQKGQGCSGVKDGVLYIRGLRQDADPDLYYQAVELDGTLYLVNVNGKVQTASSSSKSDTRPELGSGYKDFEDENGDIWVVNTLGEVQR